MTTTYTSTSTVASHTSLGYAVRDVVTLARRNLLAILRIPTAVVFALIQPVMFVLLFRYVFGGALGASVPGGLYVNFLVPGISSRPRCSVPSARPSDWPKTCRKV